MSSRWVIAREKVPSKESSAGHVCVTVDSEDSRSSGLVKCKFINGLYAEVLFWCASGPIARRWIVPTCVWRMTGCI
jgi:hypothetical protein